MQTNPFLPVVPSAAPYTILAVPAVHSIFRSKGCTIGSTAIIAALNYPAEKALKTIHPAYNSLPSMVQSTRIVTHAVIYVNRPGEMIASLRLDY